MEVLKKNILLEDSIDRTANSPTWGLLTATTFYLNIMLTQNIDNMGLFTDIDYTPENTNNTNLNPSTFYNDLYNKLSYSGITFPFMKGILPLPITGVTGTTKYILRLPSYVVFNFYDFGNRIITGSTDTKINDLKSYNTNIPYIIGFDMEKETYVDYDGVIISGSSRIVSLGEPNTYVFDTLINTYTGTLNQTYGLVYQDYTGKTRDIITDNGTTTIPLTNFNYVGQGWNGTNLSLSALTKEEYLFGIVSPPMVNSDVLIDRGITTIMDKHLRMSEIKNLAQLNRYGNGFYNLTKI